jgi:predicted GTPase
MISSDPHMLKLNIPNTAQGISEMINNGNGFHLGLRAALKSMRVKRSPKNAYVLLLGSTGAGKSSTV